MNVEGGIEKRRGATGRRQAPRLTGWRPRASALRVRAFCTLVLLDFTSILASFSLAALLRGTFFTDTSWLVILALLLPIYFVTAFNMHSYAGVNLRDPFRAVAKGVQGLLMAVAAVIFVAFCLKTSDFFPRIVVTVGTILGTCLMTTGRFLFVRHLTAIVGGNPFTVVLLRDGDAPMPADDFSLIVVADRAFDPDQHDPLMYDHLAASLMHADRVIVACAPERRAAWAHALKGANIQSEIFIPELDALAPLGLGVYEHASTVIVANGPLGLVDRVVKRGFDVVIAAGSLAVLAPVLIAVAIAIKRDSPGPVFFKQTRIGRGNRMFQMIKFRSMTAGSSDVAGDRSTARDDERITSVGGFIRRTSIDELPQLLNVLRGEMSIVGPRPHALGSRAADKLFWEVDGRYWHRHAAKPGLTGLAQVRGYRGATLLEEDLRNRLQADLEYLESWSLWRDLMIIALTFRVLLHRNAF